MEKTDGLITTEQEWYKVENTLFTYSEEEMEQNKINKAQAELVLKPKFIPVYPSMLKQWFSLIEATIFWFIDFFLDTNDRFYCTNEQLAELLSTSEKTISLAITKLKERWLLNISYRMKANWGKIRFIQIADITKCNLATLQNVKSDITKCNDIYNKKIENKIIKENKEKKWYGEFGMCYLTDSEYSKVITDYWLKNWEHLIKQVDTYCASKWKRYKNYAAAIRQFAERAGIKKIQKQTVNESWIYDLPF